jgi:hypothetical protein
MTAMNDGIGRALGDLFERNPKRAVVAIMTDGQENASTKYNAAQVKQQITLAQERGWRVMFLGANIDSFAVGASLGVARQFTQNYAATNEGLRGATASVSMNVTGYRVSSEP